MEKAYGNCMSEASMCSHCYMGMPLSIPILPDMEVNRHPETRIKEGELYCVMQLRSRGVSFVPVKEQEPGNLPHELQVANLHAEFVYE